MNIPVEAQLLRRDTDGVAWLTLNRPQARNALSMGLMTALDEALIAIGQDPTVQVVVIAGNGPAFCAGHDLREMRAHPEEASAAATFQLCSQLMQRITALPKPVIAQVHGVATAAGCQLVATCDLAIAADTARFATPGVNIGLFCSTPMVALTRKVPRAVAFEMLTTGAFITAARAQEVGLVNRVVSEVDLQSETVGLATTLAGKLGASLRIGKRAFYDQAELPLTAAYAHAGAVMVENLLDRDTGEGIAAFLDKRKPDWG